MSTVVTANAYTPNYTARPVILSNGWIVTAAKNSTTSIILYISKDGGVTWTQLCYKTVNASAGFSLASYGNEVWLLYATALDLYCVKFDATIVTNTNLTGAVSIPVGTPISVSIAVKSATELTVAWIAYVTSAYYLYSAKSVDGGATWTAQDGTAGDDSLGSGSTNPGCWVIYGSDSYPKVFYSNFNGGTIYMQAWNGSAWGAPVTIYSGSSGANYFSALAKKYGSDVGRLFMVTNTFGGSLVIYYSDNQGVTWEACTITASGLYSALGENADGDVVCMYANGTNINYQTCDDGTETFDTETLITSAATNGGQIAMMDYVVSQLLFYIWGTSTSVLADRFLYNVAPLAPTLTTKSSFDATEATSFSWAYNDPNSWDTQSAYQIQIIRVSDNAVIVDSGKVASMTSAYALAASSLANATAYQWKVKTWDALDVEGPYSSLGSFSTSAMPTVVITYPLVDSDVHPYDSVTVQWTLSDPQGIGQSAYQVELTDMADTVLYNSTKTTDVNARSKTVGYSLVNGTNYKLKMTAWNSSDIASIKMVRTFAVSYTPPALPTLVATAQDGYISIAITNPAPTGTEPTVISNDLYRRVSGAVDWERIKTGIANNGSYSDYAIASAITYEYKVRGNGDNGTSSDSSSTTSSITLSGVWLHDIASPSTTIKQFKADGHGRQTDWQAQATLLQFDGRTFPVAEFGDTELGSVSTVIQLTKVSGDLAVLEALVQRKATLCYRDGRGRKVFGVIIGLPVTEERAWGYTVTVRVDQVDYSEVV